MEESLVAAPLSVALPGVGTVGGLREDAVVAAVVGVAAAVVGVVVIRSVIQSSHDTSS